MKLEDPKIWRYNGPIDPRIQKSNNTESELAESNNTEFTELAESLVWIYYITPPPTFVFAFYASSMISNQ